MGWGALCTWPHGPTEARFTRTPWQQRPPRPQLLQVQQPQQHHRRWRRRDHLVAPWADLAALLPPPPGSPPPPPGLPPLLPLHRLTSPPLLPLPPFGASLPWQPLRVHNL